MDHVEPVGNGTQTRDRYHDLLRERARQHRPGHG